MKPSLLVITGLVRLFINICFIDLGVLNQDNFFPNETSNVRGQNKYSPSVTSNRSDEFLYL